MTLHGSVGILSGESTYTIGVVGGPPSTGLDVGVGTGEFRTPYAHFCTASYHRGSAGSSGRR